MPITCTDYSLPAPRRFARAALVPLLAASLHYATLTGRSQEALRNSMAGDAAAAAGRLQPDAMPYTVKSGDFKLLLTPSLALDWNDNVYLSKDNAQDDVILRPTMGLNVSYPVTQRNLLQLNVTAGYQEYFKHSELSSLYVQSGSALSFDIYVKDFLINLHDRFSYSQNSSTDARVANTGSLGSFQNSAGLNTTWDLQDVTLNLGYDHQTVKSTANQFNSMDHASEMLVGRAGFRWNPRFTTGVEGSGSFTAYDQMVLNNNANYSAGLYADWQPGASLHVQPRVGYTIFAFQQTSQSIQTSDMNSWYADLTVSHQLSDGVGYTFSAGHETRMGIQADAVEDSYIRPGLHWNIIKGFDIGTTLFYEHGDQGQGNVRGNLVESYDWYGGSLSVSHHLTSRLTLGLNYRLTLRSSDLANNSYAQNIVGLQLTYQ